jgi:hypothetical protein
MVAEAERRLGGERFESDARGRMLEDLYKDCTIDCEREVECAVCRKRKPPIGRDVSAYTASSYCEHECAGHNVDPRAGHLWPGELARIREYEKEQAR